ncbi:CHAT domain-containing protein [Sinomicrobium soli]|uniref:CHAT domain-containing protein n=1 Tax=Sinomicrobium sp. N-1-3-6 TaxID=2219864 RepID=UPI000DCDCDBE|nr:CHAT domain-containing tetratricopeptide repeat protein [Sinomicrobium sp. N-1-3-6]RAV30545.1 hypothetical protein DN748_03345 [Sinomicrobium sp. N-1-3-6]
MEVLSGGYDKKTVQKRWLTAVLLLYASLVAAQLTPHIYDDVDRLSATPSPVLLAQLETKEIQYASQAGNPEEYTALLILQCNMGYYYRESGMYPKAIALYEKAWQNYRDHGIRDYDITEFCLKPLGNLYTISGNLVRAENTIKSYLFLAQEQNDTEQETAAVLNLSVVYHNAGNFRMAIRLLETRLSASSSAPEQKTALLNNLATNYFALEQYDTAEQLLQKTSKKHPGTASSLYRNMAQLARAKGQLSQAENYLYTAENELLKQSFTARELARIYVEKAELASLGHQYAKAEDLLFRALGFLLPQHREHTLPAPEILYAENVFISVFDAMAALQSEPERSLECYDLSFHVSQLIRMRITTQESAILQLSDDRDRSEKCIALLYEMYRDKGAPSSMVRAFDYSENSKAAILKETGYRRSLTEAFPGAPLLPDIKKWSVRQEQVVNKLVRAQLSGDVKDSVKHYTESLNDIQLQLGTLYEKAYLKYPDMSGSGPKTSLNSIRQQLQEDDACMVVYFYGKQHRFTFSVSAHSVEMYREDNTAGADEMIREYLSLFENPHTINNNPSDYARKAHALYNNLFPFPVSGKNLIIVPDGLLSFIPFETLLTAKSGNVSYKAMPFLLYRHQVSYLTSASFYHRPPPPVTGKKLLGIFPVFEGTPEALPYSIEEARSIDALTEATIITGNNATRNFFTRNAKNYGILHLSTHASGGNFVVPPGIAFSDDMMLLHELYSMEFRPELVVLSACETGIGKLQKGEGPISMARAFQYAGAKRLLFSLWKVNDRATAQLMAFFYQHYESCGAAAANRKAKTDYLTDDKTPNTRKSPYYWGAFVYYGDLQQGEKPAPYYHFLIPAILIVVFAVILRYLSRRKTIR